MFIQSSSSVASDSRPRSKQALALARGLAWLAWLVGAALCWQLQLLSPYLTLSLALSVVAGLLVRGTKRRSASYEWDFASRVLRGRASILAVSTVVIRSLSWVAIATFTQWAAVRVVFSEREYLAFAVLLPWSLALLRVACEWCPPRGERRIVGTLAHALLLVSLLWEVGGYLRAPQDGVVLDFPFRGTWAVAQGGGALSFNHHYPILAQRFALDLVAVEPGKLTLIGSDSLEAYGCWGKAVLAPGAGRVIAAVGDRRDNPIGQTDSEHPEGNHVIVELAPKRYVLVAHLQRGSVAVNAGETVRSGQELGRCGNSGNTSAPHLHLQAQTSADIWSAATRALPMRFREKDGVVTRPLRRNDVIRTHGSELHLEPAP